MIRCSLFSASQGQCIREQFHLPSHKFDLTVEPSDYVEDIPKEKRYVESGRVYVEDAIRENERLNK